MSAVLRKATINSGGSGAPRTAPCTAAQLPAAPAAGEIVLVVCGGAQVFGVEPTIMQKVPGLMIYRKIGLTTLPRLGYLGNIVRLAPGRKGGGSSMRRALHMTELVTQARLKELLVYDRKTGHFYWRETRGGIGRGTKAGTVNADGYIRICIDRQPYYAHRLAWVYVHGDHPIGNIDHRHGDRRDNRIAKLRQSFGPENHWNSRRRKARGYKGVYQSRSGKFVAKIQWYGRAIHIGTYATAEEAARNYDVHAWVLFGDFARPNGLLSKIKAVGKNRNPQRKRGGAKRGARSPLDRTRTPAAAHRAKRSARMSRRSIRREGIQSIDLLD
jgi:hypothetical protein